MVDWVRGHLLIALPIFGGVLLVLGAVIVIEQAPAHGGTSAQVWGSGSAPVNPTYQGQSGPTLLQPTIGGGPSPEFLPIAPKPPLGETPAADTDLASLLATLTTQLQTPVPQGTDSGVTSISSYDFIPQGLLSTSSSAVVHRSGKTLELYDYGNEIGSYVQSYENSHRGVATILKNQIEDRADSAKGQAVRDVGSALAKIGVSMEHMDQIPASVGTLHTNLAKSYEDAGAKLAAIPDAQSDQQFVAAIEAYNASADALTQNFVTLAEFFSLSQVTFTSDDSGSVFSFTSGGSL
jgi:hypothetical protein